LDKAIAWGKRSIGMLKFSGAHQVR
jgi:hypothetical protein